MTEKLPAMENVCSKDALRPVMQCVLLTQTYFVATNAHVLVWHETSKWFDEGFIEQIPEKGFLIDKKDWKVLRDANYLDLENGMIRAINSRKGDSYIKPSVNGEDMKYPNWEAVIPEPNNEPLDKIGINPELLMAARKAIGNGKANFGLHFTGSNRGILIRSADGSYNSYKDAAGLIMPVVYDYDMLEAKAAREAVLKEAELEPAA